jgi:hypothetical protein
MFGVSVYVFFPFYLDNNVKVIAQADRVRSVATDLYAKAIAELDRLRALGWTQADFAKALGELLDSDA